VSSWAKPIIRPGKRVSAAALALVLAGGCQQALSAAPAESFVAAPAATLASHEAPGMAQALFSGGCYWGVEGVFSHVAGVTSAVSGFHGGSADTAQYARVSQGDTGHAESVRVIQQDPLRPVTQDIFLGRRRPDPA
jgi:peptide-methionine (S)-S-oxide reductase